MVCPTPSGVGVAQASLEDTGMPQAAAARRAQSTSQRSLQQNGSAAHAGPQQAAFAHPTPSCSSKQGPVAVVHAGAQPIWLTSTRRL